MTSPDPYAVNPHPETAQHERQSYLSALGDHPFFDGLETAQLEVLAANAMPVEFPAGETIFREGDNANRFYLIHEGEVVLESDDGSGRPTMIDTVGRDDVLGWSWMFPPFYWHFDARATKPTKATFFYGTRLREACEADPKLGFALATRMAEAVIHRLQATRRKVLKRRPVEG